MNNTYEQEIDLKDLIFYIVKRWRQILLIAVILAVVLGGYKLCRGVLNDKQYVDDLQKTYDSDFKSYHLTKDGYERKINTLVQNIDYEENYEKNSVLFQLDPFNKCVAKMNLFIRTEEEYNSINMVDPADSLVKAYSSMLKSKSTIEKASLENSLDISYLRELLNIEADYNGNMISITVTYKDENGAQKILDTILDSIKTSQNEVESNLGIHSIIFMNGETSMIADQKLADFQNERSDKLTQMQKNLEETQLALDELVEPQQPTNESFSGVLKSAIKYGFAGGVFGAFMVAFIFCIIYMMNPRLRSSEEFISRFNTKILGTFSTEVVRKKQSKLDIWINKLEGKEYISKGDVIKRIIAGITIYTEMEKTILLTGTVEPDLLKNIQLEIKAHFPELIFEIGIDMNRNFETLTRLTAVDGVILVEKCGVSKYKDIENELEIICNLNKKIIGSIIL